MQSTESLADLRNHLYQRAERKWIASLILACGALVVTVSGVWIQSVAVVTLVGLMSLIAPIAITWLRESASTELVRGDKCRRLMLHADSLGHSIPASQLAIARGWGLGVSLSPAPFVPPYYASERQPGPQRLADNATEAAFFTSLLASKIEAILRGAFGIGVMLSIVALLIADIASVMTTAAAIAAAKSIGVFLCFLISGDFLVLAKKFGELENESRLVYEACARMRDDQNATVQEVIAVCEDYGAALLLSPPIPAWLYRLYRDDLNRLYRESHFRSGGDAGTC